MRYAKPDSFLTTPIKTTNDGEAGSNLQNLCPPPHPQGIIHMLFKASHAAEGSAFSFSVPLNRYITVTTAFPPALTKRAVDDPAAL